MKWAAVESVSASFSFASMRWATPIGGRALAQRDIDAGAESHAASSTSQRALRYSVPASKMMTPPAKHYGCGAG